MELEGGYVYHPEDPGGETKYGISKASYPELQIAEITRQEAKNIYRRDFWDRYELESFPKWIRLAFFDAAVNMGANRATRLLQKTLNVTEDGIIGPVTRGELISERRSQIVTGYLTERAIYYAERPHADTFIKGWLKRLMHVALKQGVSL